MSWIVAVNMGSKSGQCRKKREYYWKESFAKTQLLLEVHLIKKQCKSKVSVTYTCPVHDWGQEICQDLQSDLLQLMFFTFFASKWKSIYLAYTETCWVYEDLFPVIKHILEFFFKIFLISNTPIRNQTSLIHRSTGLGSELKVHKFDVSLKS